MIDEGRSDATVAPQLDMFQQTIALGRPGRPEEMAALLGFLAGTESTFFCGSIVFSDGGTDALFRGRDFPTALEPPGLSRRPRRPPIHLRTRPRSTATGASSRRRVWSASPVTTGSCRRTMPLEAWAGCLEREPARGPSPPEEVSPMTDTHPAPRRSTGPAGGPRGSSRMLVTAWISLGVLVLALPFGRWVSIALLEAFGYDPVEETEPPGLGLLAFVVGVAVVLLPASVALWSGLRAWRAGHGSAVVVAVFAGMAIALVLLGLPLYLSRLLGWPLVLALGVGLVAVGWFARPRRWGRSAYPPSP